jgi:hypothetical protein
MLDERIYTMTVDEAWTSAEDIIRRNTDLTAHVDRNRLLAFSIRKVPGKEKWRRAGAWVPVNIYGKRRVDKTFMWVPV